MHNQKGWQARSYVVGSPPWTKPNLQEFPRTQGRGVGDVFWNVSRCVLSTANSHAKRKRLDPPKRRRLERCSTHRDESENARDELFGPSLRLPKQPAQSHQFLLARPTAFLPTAVTKESHPNSKDLDGKNRTCLEWSKASLQRAAPFVLQCE